MKALRVLILAAISLLFAGFLLAQDSVEAKEIPAPPVAELPELFVVVLGAVSSLIAEFVQKQKSPLASLGIAVSVSAILGGLGALYQGVGLSDFPVFIVQTFSMATLVWAILFKAAGLSKTLGTNRK